MVEEFITKNVVIQLEVDLDEQAKNQYRVITYFRHTHQVHVSKYYYKFNDAVHLFRKMCFTEI